MMTATRTPFDDRRRQWRRQRWFRIVIAVLVIALIGTCIWAVAFSHLLAARSVKITGIDQLTVEEVRSVAAVDLGTPLVRLDLDAIEERVQSLTMVESVEVSRSWPRTVKITVTERTAIAWLTENSEIRGIDRYGANFRSFDEQPELTEIRVDVTDSRLRQQSIEGLGSVLSNLAEADPTLLSSIAYGTAESQDSLTFVLTDGRLVRWGNAEKFDAKLEVIAALLNNVSAGEYDVSAPEQPTTRE